MRLLYKQQSSFVAGMMTIIVAATTFLSCSKTAMNAPDASSRQDFALFKNTARTSAATQTPRTGVAVSQHINGFYEYLPKSYSTSLSTNYPLLICMHGVGQVGNGTTDLPCLLSYGPAMMINNGTFPVSFTVDGKTYSMIIITPQLTEAGMFPTDIDSLIEYCKANYRVDTNRVYLAGLSIGGANVWHYAGFSPATAAKITAMVPICAWTPPQDNYQVTQEEAQNIAGANIKIWQTHNYDDPTAMFSWSVAQANLVINSSPTPNPLPKLTCFNSNSHDAWTKTYDPTYKESGMNIYQWMLHYAKDSTSSSITQKVPLTQVITLKGANNFYLHNNGDGSPLFLNSTSFTLWEGYAVVGVSANKVALQNQGLYVTKINPASVTCTATTVGAQETFLWIFNADGTVSFKGNNSRYLSNNNGMVSCLATTIGPNEKFWINR